MTNGSALLALERKRVLDFVWLFTLGSQACALLLFAWLGWIDRSIAPLGRSVLACSVLFAIVADLSYRIKDARAIDASTYATQLVGIGFMTYLWTLSGGAAYAAGLAFLVPPLVASGMVGSTWLPRITAALALAAVWTAATVQRGALPWSDTGSAAASQSDAVLWLFSIASIGLAVASPVLSGLFVRLHQRIRSQTQLDDEARGTFEAVMSGARDPSVIVYADTLQLAHASDSFYRRMLLDRRAVAGRSLYNLIHFANRERMEAMFAEESGVVPFQQVEIGPEPIAANLRYFHLEHAGTRYLHVAFEEVTDLFYFQNAFDAIDDAVLIVGDVGDLRYANRAAKALLGELYVGKPMLSVLRSHRLIPSGGLAAARNVERLLLGETPFHQTVLAPRMGHGQVSRVFWLRKFSEDQVRADRASRDALTGVLNRRTFERDLRRQVHEATSSAPVALALWGLDHFKESRDQHGEAASDQLLRAFANALGDQIRPSDGLYRLDGDTFAVIYLGADLPGVEGAVQRVLLGLGGQTVEIDDEEFRISASAGVTVAKLREATAALVARADQALWAAKDGGGGCVVAMAPEEK